MKRGDIYLVSLDPTEGREQRGSRPVLVVSPTEFNEATKLPVICPITSGGDFARRIGFAVPVTGIKTTGVVRCDQPRVLDLGARNARRVDTLPASIMDEVLAKLAPIFE
ncbi:MAG: type II toxin-antitoxin system PemK/MazF family toxin [Sulfuritalea sp.]|jgi:mRNA interferase ChpB|nr:type II toxin-antitoxin system PemK/MazF family toxin [Sulfuritalea sp.]